MSAQRSRYSILSDIEEILKVCFTNEVNAKRAEMGRAANYHPSGDKWNWQRYASFVFDRNLEIPSWVRYCVRQMPQPQPSHLCSAKIYERYQQTETRRYQQSRTCIQSKFDSEKSRAKGELGMLLEAKEEGLFEQDMTREDIIASVLCNEALSFSPLFRYCWSVDQNLPQLGAPYYTEAICQYVVNPDVYDSVWGDWIPAEFKEEARELFRVRT